MFNSPVCSKAKTTYEWTDMFCEMSSPPQRVLLHWGRAYLHRLDTPQYLGMIPS